MNWPIRAPPRWSYRCILLKTFMAGGSLLLKTLSDADLARTFRHPELGVVRLDTNLALYAWHGRHHTAHITGLRERNGWK